MLYAFLLEVAPGSELASYEEYYSDVIEAVDKGEAINNTWLQMDTT